MTTHGLIRHSFKLFKIFAFVAQLTILKTVTAIVWVFALARIFIERHQTAFTRSAGSFFHSNKYDTAIIQAFLSSRKKFSVS